MRQLNEGSFLQWNMEANEEIDAQGIAMKVVNIHLHDFDFADGHE